VVSSPRDIGRSFACFLLPQPLWQMVRGGRGRKGGARRLEGCAPFLVIRRRSVSIGAGRKGERGEGRGGER